MNDEQFIDRQSWERLLELRKRVESSMMDHEQQPDPVDETYDGDGYCVRCKDKIEFVGLIVVLNGRRFARGECPVCGTKITRILGNA